MHKRSGRLRLAHYKKHFSYLSHLQAGIQVFVESWVDCSLYFPETCRFVEKGNLEVQLFILTSKLRANHQKMYTPPESKALSDINRVCIGE